MSQGVEKRAGASARHFKKIVWPEIREWFDAQEVVPVESVTDSEMADNLDRLAGIDAWAIDKERGMFGIGSRVQIEANISLPWRMLRTHTVRKTAKRRGLLTEFEKRVKAIDSDDLYPKYTVQAYLDREGGELQNAAAVRTEPLMEYIQDGLEDRNYKVQHAPTGETFYVVNWIDLEEYLYDSDYDNDLIYYDESSRDEWYRMAPPISDTEKTTLSDYSRSSLGDFAIGGDDGGD